MDSVMKGLMGQCLPPQNFWARIAPDCDNYFLKVDDIIVPLVVIIHVYCCSYQWDSCI